MRSSKVPAHAGLGDKQAVPEPKRRHALSTSLGVGTQVRDAGPDAWLGREAPADPALDGDEAGPLALAAPAPALELASAAECASAAASQAIIAGPARATTAHLRPLKNALLFEPCRLRHMRMSRN